MNIFFELLEDGIFASIAAIGFASIAILQGKLTLSVQE